MLMIHYLTDDADAVNQWSYCFLMPHATILLSRSRSQHANRQQLAWICGYLFSFRRVEVNDLLLGSISSSASRRVPQTRRSSCTQPVYLTQFRARSVYSTDLVNYVARTISDMTR